MKKHTLTISLCLVWLFASGQIFFSDVATAVGIDHSYSGVLGGGVSFYDFNGDGLDDLTLATGEGEPLHFYQNEGGQFVKLMPLVPHTGQAKQVLWADFDNDGDADLYVATYAGPNRLYENLGDLNFQDITESAGLPINDLTSYGAIFADFDRDGWLDLYFNERVPFMIELNRHYLFHNNADGTFTDVTELSQTADAGKIPFCSAALDYNNDRWPDIYTAHDKMPNPNTLLENNGDGTFTDVSVASNADLEIDAMCVTAGDYNNDGRMDIYVTNTPPGSALLHNLGPLGAAGQVKFANAAPFAGVGFYGIGWGSVFLDADNDCDLDLYVSGSLAGANVISSAFFENKNNGTFQQPNAGFVGDTTETYCNAWGDFNDDGFPDIIVQNQMPTLSQLWQNSGGDHQWLKLKLQGVLSNRDGIGARIEVHANGRYQLRYTQCGSGFLGQNSTTEIIGTGAAEVIDSVVVTWPTGHIDRLFSLAADQKILLVEGSTTNGEIAVDPDVQLTIVVSPAVEKGKGIQAKLFPSPVSKLLQVEVEGNFENMHYLVCDVSGHAVAAGNFAGKMTLDVGDLSAGAYFLIITDTKGRRFTEIWIKK